MVRLLDAQGSCGGQRSGMERTTLHIVCGDSRSRAEQARVVFALGHHAEVYASLEELFERPPDEGIVLASAESEHLRGPDLIRRVVAAGIWLPIVLVGQEPEVDEVVAAIKAGAIDYLALPLEINSFAARLQGIREEAGQQASTRRREVEARRSIKRLSPRERQVLELLSAGCSNKEIARRLGISPRTVEIHRGNMMGKLHAGHPADAVRLWIDAKRGLSHPAASEPHRANGGSAGGAADIGRIEAEDPGRPEPKRQRQ